MARYNAWQNRSLYREAGRLSDAQRREDRGAFFRSIHGTLGHLLWGDTMWMSRFDGWEKPPVGPAEGERWLDWEGLAAARLAADERIAAWAARLTEGDLAGDLTWHSGVLKRDMTRPRWVLVVHMFNHQTHHRGQAHALLTGFGARPDDTDLGFMPHDA
jgi:uncharacterized damage-inducible protein DinB